MELVSFTIKNFKSFYTEQTIEFNTDKHNANVFLGANGSGKSNLFDAMEYFCSFIQNSTSFNAQQQIPVPFLYAAESRNQPTRFKLVAKDKRRKYIYQVKTFKGRIDGESLKINSETIFSRDSVRNGRYIDFGFTNELLKTTSEHALLLTKAWENENKYAKQFFETIGKIKFVRTTTNWGLIERRFSEKLSSDDGFKQEVLDLLRRADLSIRDIVVDKISMPDEVYASLPFKEEIKKRIDRSGYNLSTIHMVRSKGGDAVATVRVPFGAESAGTKRILLLAEPIIESLKNGYTLYVDDFETYLHPKECELIVKLFDSKSNLKKAKLIVNTHEVSLINTVGRDNLRLFGKNGKEESIISTLEGVRADDPAIEKKYRAGILGGVPNIEL